MITSWVEGMGDGDFSLWGRRGRVKGSKMTTGFEGYFSFIESLMLVGGIVLEESPVVEAMIERVWFEGGL